MLAHLEKEWVELEGAIGEGRIYDIIAEMVDCMMLMMDFASHSDYSMHTEIRRKLEINKRRRWRKPGPDGAVEHVRDGR